MLQTQSVEAQLCSAALLHCIWCQCAPARCNRIPTKYTVKKPLNVSLYCFFCESDNSDSNYASEWI